MQFFSLISLICVCVCIDRGIPDYISGHKLPICNGAAQIYAEHINYIWCSQSYQSKVAAFVGLRSFDSFGQGSVYFYLESIDMS